jgi:preprotein translocase subunit SecD
MTEAKPKRHWFRFSLLAFLICITLFGCLLGLILRHRDPHTPKPLAKSATLEVYLVSPAGVLTPHSLPNRSNGSDVYLTDPPILTAGDFATVQRWENKIQSGQDWRPDPILSFHLTAAGASRLAAVTKTSQGMSLAIVANGNIICVSKIFGPLSDSFVIGGGDITKHREEIFSSLTGGE